jgi:hypothetical protein
MRDRESESGSDTEEELDEVQLRIRIRDLERRVRRMEMMYLDKTAVLTRKGFRQFLVRTVAKQLPLIVGVVFIVYSLRPMC